MSSRIAITFFTSNGEKLYEKLHSQLEEELIVRGSEEALSQWAKGCFEENIPMVFIGATGIAVRTIAPYLESKTTDPAVIVMDELGKYVIPLVSGHLGGANELAVRLADITGANAVITTATDINDSFSPDLFAKENNLSIANRDGIKKVASRALEGKSVTLSVKNYPPEENVDIIISNIKSDIDRSTMLISPREYSMGIGCRKGISVEAIEEAVGEAVIKAQIDIDDIFCVASIDIKENEAGIRQWCERHRKPFITFDSQMLNKAKGEYSASEYVLSKVGVDNVCERAAVLSAGTGGSLVLKKQAGNGVTVAIAKRITGM